MTEEVKQEVQSEQQPEQQQEHKVDVYEQRALEMGWRPKEEWDGPEEDFIEAKEFVRRQPLFEKIESQSKAIKQLTQAFDALKTHHSKVKETEYKRALDSLKQAKKQALIDGETERALAYEEKIEEVEQQKAEFDASAAEVNIPQEPVLNPEFVAWKQRNGWYNKDTELREFADTYGIMLARKGMEPQAVLQAVEKKVKETFKEKFVNPNRERAGAVEAPSRRGGSSDGFSMSEDERSIMKKIVRAGGITEAEYIKELRRVKGM